MWVSFEKKNDRNHILNVHTDSVKTRAHNE